MAQFQPPPTYAEVVLVDPISKKAVFNPIWLKWFVDLTGFISASSGAGGTVIHNNTTSKQGGGGTEFFHLTNAEYAVAQAVTTNGTAAVGQLPGTTTNDNAAAGKVGQIMTNSLAIASATALTTATAKNIITLSLTPGDWDVSGVVGFIANALTTITSRTAAINTTSATLPAFDTGKVSQIPENLTGGADLVLPTPKFRVSINANTTVYLIAQAAFGVNAMTAYGFISARRVR